MYVVLFFEKSCAAVPDIWVREKENQCWWPPKGVNVKKAVSERIPHENNWPLYPFHKLWGPYGKSISLYCYKKKYVFNSIHLFPSKNNKKDHDRFNLNLI